MSQSRVCGQCGDDDAAREKREVITCFWCRALYGPLIVPERAEELSTGSPAFDEFVKEGLPRRAITMQDLGATVVPATDDPALWVTPPEVIQKVRAILDGSEECGPECPHVYWCPQSNDVECGRHGGFDVCCAAPQNHRPATPWDSLGGEEEEQRYAKAWYLLTGQSRTLTGTRGNRSQHLIHEVCWSPRAAMDLKRGHRQRPPDTAVVAQGVPAESDVYDVVVDINKVLRAHPGAHFVVSISRAAPWPGMLERDQSVARHRRSDLVYVVPCPEDKDDVTWLVAKDRWSASGVARSTANVIDNLRYAQRQAPGGLVVMVEMRSESGVPDFGRVPEVAPRWEGIVSARPTHVSMFSGRSREQSLADDRTDAIVYALRSARSHQTQILKLRAEDRADLSPAQKRKLWKKGKAFTYAWYCKKYPLPQTFVSITPRSELWLGGKKVGDVTNMHFGVDLKDVPTLKGFGPLLGDEE